MDNNLATMVRSLPQDLRLPATGDAPVFQQPWEARIFAIVLSLHQQGAFQWADFQALLIDEIKRTESEGAYRGYYENWFAAAERLIQSLEIANDSEIDAEVARLRPDDRTIVLTKS